MHILLAVQWPGHPGLRHWALPILLHRYRGFDATVSEHTLWLQAQKYFYGYVVRSRKFGLRLQPQRGF